MTLNDLLAKRNQDKLTQLDRDLQETLLYAPRRLTCPWIGCSYTETIFASLDALINVGHVRLSSWILVLTMVPACSSLSCFATTRSPGTAKLSGCMRYSSYVVGPVV